MIYGPDAPAFDGAIYCKGDIRDHSKVFAVIDQCDCVLHLAGILGTSETLDKPVEPAVVNIIGSLNVFDACRQYEKRCCYICVGNHFMLNTYAITKTAAERFALMYNREHHTQIAIVRGLNAYGPRQKAKPVRKVIPNFVIPAVRGESLIVYGSGEQVMDFIYVADLAEILCRALLDDHRCYDRIIEAGSGRRTTINQIAAMVVQLAESSSKIEHRPMRGGELHDSVVLADTQTLTALDYGPDDMTDLEEGLKKTIRYYAEHIEEYA
jgi:nucleoside-diphosphate-sugar epimerase